MPLTAKFSWTTPTPGGSSGAWGTILNDVIDDIDADLYANAGKLSEQMLVLAMTGAGSGWSNTNAGVSANHSGGPGHFIVPLPVRKGQRITAFTTRGAKSSTAVATAKLCYYDNTGAEVVVSAGHSLSSLDFVAENVTTSGLSHDVDKDRAYYVKIEVGIGTGNLFAQHVQIAVSATP